MHMKDFNKMYGLPVAGFPGFEALQNQDPLKRLLQLRKILHDEVIEIDDIINMLMNPDDGTPKKADVLDVLTAVADLMGDLQVYAQSEMVKWGLPIEGVHEIIMESNASKLGADGKPIVIDGKLQKGPNYWKPEPRIRELLGALRAAGTANREYPEGP